MRHRTVPILPCTNNFLNFGVISSDFQPNEKIIDEIQPLRFVTVTVLSGGSFP